MQEVLNVVLAVRRRVFLNRFLRHAFGAGLYAVGLSAAAFLCAKIVFFPNAIPILGGATVAALAAVIIYATAAARTDMFPAAVAADEKLGLGERLSSAMLIVDDPSPIAAAVVLDARLHAKRINVKDRFPVDLPDRSWRVAVAVVALAGILVLPQFDAFGRHTAFVKKQKEKEQVAKEIKELRKQIEVAKKTLEGRNLDVVAELDNLGAKLVDLEKAGLTKKEALAALSDSMQSLTEKMKDAAKDFSQKSNSMDADLSKALADQQKALGEQQKALGQQMKALEAAKDVASELAKELEKGALSKEQAQKMAEALQKMAESLPKDSEAAKSLQQAAEALKSGNQTAAAQAAQKALTDIQTSMPGIQSKLGLTSQQMAALQNQMSQMGQQGPNGQSPSGTQGSQSAGTMADMMQAGQSGNMQGDAKDVQAMRAALNGMNNFKQNTTGTESMSAADALAQLDQASNGMGNRPGSGSGVGGGMGGPGRGRGNTWDVAPETGVAPEASNIDGEMRKGQMLASFYTKGGQLKNESKVQYEEIVLESEQEAKDALTDQKVPRTYEKVVREYFDSIESPANP